MRKKAPGDWWGRTSRQDILPSALLTLTRSLLIPTSGSTMSQSYHSSNHSSSICQDRGLLIRPEQRQSEAGGDSLEECA